MAGQSEIKGTHFSEYSWKPYPSKSWEEAKAFEYTMDDVYGMPDGQKRKTFILRSNYIGRIIHHRAANGANYEFLARMIKKPDTDKTLINEILKNHREKENKINSLSENKAFRSLEYTAGKSEAVQ